MRWVLSRPGGEMSFFEKNREELARSGIDPSRLPPGQYGTDRFPILHEGPVPDYGDFAMWSFEVAGLVENPVKFSYEEFRALPVTAVHCDIHCVTKWSKFDTEWEGVSVDHVASLAGVLPEAKFVIAHAEFGYTANLPVEDLLGRPGNLLAYRFAREELEPIHGGPLRLVVPHLYFWKSAKWLRALEFVDSDEPGFWESNGYHNYGDPWREQRYWGD